jgi:hypothetical protein
MMHYAIGDVCLKKDIEVNAHVTFTIGQHKGAATKKKTKTMKASQKKEDKITEWNWQTGRIGEDQDAHRDAPKWTAGESLCVTGNVRSNWGTGANARVIFTIGQRRVSTTKKRRS